MLKTPLIDKGEVSGATCYNRPASFGVGLIYLEDIEHNMEVSHES